MLEYRLLAFKVVDLQVPDKLFCYSFAPAKLPVVRSLLNILRTPHLVTYFKGELSICTPVHVEELVERALGFEIGEKPAEQVDVVKLLRSSVRVVLQSAGWATSNSKLFDPSRVEFTLGENLVNVHRGVVTSSDLVSGEYALFLDPSRKLEFTKTMDELEREYQPQVKRIRWLKVKGTPKSFFIEEGGTTSEIDPRTLVSKAAETLNHMLRNYSYSKRTAGNVRDFSADELVLLRPKSRRLFEELKNAGLLVRLNDMDYAVLPKNALTPVASTDNVALFGDFKPPILDPETRLNLALETLRLLKKVKLRGMEFELEEDPLNVQCDLLESYYLRVRKTREPVESISDFVTKQKNAEIVCAEPRKFHVVPVYYRLDTLGDMSGGGFRGLDSALEGLVKYFTSQYKKYKGLLKLFMEGPIAVNDLGELESALKHVTGILGFKTRKMAEKLLLVVIVFGAFEDSVEKSKVKYTIADNGFIPVIIDVKETVESSARKVKKRNKDAIANVDLESLTSSLKFKIDTALKHKLVSLGCLQFDVLFPDFLKSYKRVIGIDATRVVVGRGQFLLAVPVVILQESGALVHRYYDVLLGENELELFASVVRKAVYDKGYGDSGSEYKSIVIINKENITGLLRTEPMKEVMENAILVGMTKTHSYSRILAKRGNKYYNVEFGTFLELRRETLENYEVRKILAVTTQYLGTRGLERGTKKSTFIAIARKELESIKTREFLEFLLSMNFYGNTSLTWLLSLPWPLHRAHELSEEIHRIAVYLKKPPPQSNVLEKL